MIDINFIRTNPDIIKDACQKKQARVDIDRLLEIDELRRELLRTVEDMRAQKNKANQKIKKSKNFEEKKDIILEMQKLNKKIDKIEKEFKEIDKEFEIIMLLVPNIPSEDSPVGASEKFNKEIERWGEVPKFDFLIKNHIELGKELDLIDTKAGVKISGFRGYFLKNEAALLHFSLMWLSIKKMEQKGFKLFVPPTIIREFSLIGSGHFPTAREEVYQIANFGRLENKKATKEPMFLAGTAEPSLISYYADETLDEKDLPIKICGISQCYRSEAGSYGKDTHGLYRLHEFMKVEQVVICRDDIEESNKWLEEMKQISQEILKDLKLPHRVIQICTGDMGIGKHKMYDIETWMPSRNAFGETHSDSNLTTWQSRRLNIRYRTKEKNKRYVHTLNNTVIASPRILIALLECNQQKDGSILIPEVLRPYLGNQKYIKK
ncbi:serine--tRNA ligase [Candidatus Parcubacteria bacterium]|nr:serine--tRNA ligase [Candidatus Parcubacteria bacterium]